MYLTEESARLAHRSHLDVDDDDPTVGQKFSTETLRRGDAGKGSLPSTVHGAPETAEESREVLARLKRMAGFESQDFDPGVRTPPWRDAPARKRWAARQTVEVVTFSCVELRAPAAALRAASACEHLRGAVQKSPFAQTEMPNMRLYGNS